MTPKLWCIIGIGKYRKKPTPVVLTWCGFERYLIYNLQGDVRYFDSRADAKLAIRGLRLLGSDKPVSMMRCVTKLTVDRKLVEVELLYQG